MRIALLDNGSLIPAAHATLRAVAAELSHRAGVAIEAVSWKHSDRAPRSEGGDEAPWTLAAWIRNCVAGGEDAFLFVPFFISPQGAIAGALRRDLEALQSELSPFRFQLTAGLAPSTLARIAADRVRAALPAPCNRPPVVLLVDHGGPSPASASVRDTVAELLAALLGNAVACVTAASMESPDGEAFAFNRPLFADALASVPADDAVIVVPLFLSPGRHAGPDGDLMQIAGSRSQGRHRFTDLIGTHSLAVDALASTLNPFLAPAVSA